MRYVEDMTVPEIAEALKEKENTVSVRIHRALKKTQDLLEDLNTYEQA
jgi:DNA-directed RNA polymerase specialized sigma24 family protein